LREENDPVRDKVFVGRRSGGVAQVEVYGPEGIAPLDDAWVDPAHGFAWGAPNQGSLALAHAVLASVFGVTATEGLAVTFVADVITRLPAQGFVLDEEDVRRWLDPPAGTRLTHSELVEHLGAIALADDEEQAELRHRIVERCWDDRTLRN